MRGRKPQPSHLKLLKGETRPSRNNPNEPVVGMDEMAPTMPLNEKQLVVWNQLVPELVRCNIAKNTDCHALTLLVQAEELRQGYSEILSKTGLMATGSKGQVIANPMFKAMMDAQDRVARLMTEFGMTPSSRTRIDAAPPAKPEGFGID